MGLTIGSLFLVIGLIVAFISAFIEGAWHSRLISVTLCCLCLGILLLGVGVGDVRIVR